LKKPWSRPAGGWNTPTRTIEALCGHGETCRVCIPIMLLGEGVKITPDMIPDVILYVGRNIGEILAIEPQVSCK